MNIYLHNNSGHAGKLIKLIKHGSFPQSGTVSKSPFMGEHEIHLVNRCPVDVVSKSNCVREMEVKNGLHQPKAANKQCHLRKIWIRIPRQIGGQGLLHHPRPNRVERIKRQFHLYFEETSDRAMGTSSPVPQTEHVYKISD